MPALRPTLDRKNTSVVVIDIQERLVPSMWNFEAVEKYAKATIMAGRALDLPVLCTEQYPKGLGPTIASVRELLPNPPLVKTHFSCAADAGFTRALAETGRKQVLLVGIESHVCVFQTCRDLLSQGYQPFVCADAVTSRFEEHRRIALELMRDIGAVVTSAETSIFDLLHESGTPEFKTVSQFVK